VGVDLFQVFVTPLEDRVPVLRAENIHELLLLYNELGFAGLLSQVADFISRYSIAESEARQRLVQSRKKTSIKTVSHPRNVSHQTAIKDIAASAYI
jgi:hypothetical protein